jgi:hypothetical protein
MNGDGVSLRRRLAVLVGAVDGVATAEGDGAMESTAATDGDGAIDSMLGAGEGVSCRAPIPSTVAPAPARRSVAASVNIRRQSMRRRPVASSMTRRRTRGETGTTPSSPRSRMSSRRIAVAVARQLGHAAR